VRTHGVVREPVPVDAPWHDVRACVQVDEGRAQTTRHDAIEAKPPGDLRRAAPRYLYPTARLANEPEARPLGEGQSTPRCRLWPVPPGSPG
jgi:hypothetical protein